ncbi:MAG: 1-aminocyclopropane-1-carboxylate deaminase/D-cysteine desulfhydrase [Anaerolineales bacterium]
MKKLEVLPRTPLANLPTPIQPLPRLGSELGIELWVKRDDLTGLAFGGNKTRKLELLVADAQANGADTLVTTGAIQSNHCRQTAAAAARAGLKCDLVLVGEPPETPQGNLLLDHLLGADIHWTDKAGQGMKYDQVMAELGRAGGNPYAIPYGGSNPLGVAAYALAMKELLDQDPAFDAIMLASSSGGTQAGLILGAEGHGFNGRILGISIEPVEEELIGIIRQLLTDTVDQFELDLKPENLAIEVSDDYLGAGYAVMGQLEKRAIERFAATEGVLLDPVYTGRAAGGMLDLVEKGAIKPGQRVLFWHTGGPPALFAYNSQFSSAGR